MASVAICPHCYLQLVVPDGVESNEQVECPTCSREFSLDRAVLRAIPEVVRRGRSATAPTNDAIALPGPGPATVEVAEEVDVVDQLAERLDIAATSPDDAEEFVEQLKSRIEQELATGNLLPGMSGTLSLETPAGLESPLSPLPIGPEPLDQWHRPTVRLNELTELEDDHVEHEVDKAADDRSASESHEVEMEDELAADDEGAELIAESTDEVLADAADPVPTEPIPARPAATTLADLMPRGEDYEAREEAADAPGPSFELPNVPLTPPHSATVEFDPAMPFGPTADSEFELDNIDFDSNSADEEQVVESVIDEGDSAADSTVDYQNESAAYDEETADYEDDSVIHEDEAAESVAPVFSEPPANPPSNPPFVLPGLPPRRKKNNFVRTLVGTALGGVVGSLGALYVLLWILGPEGDFLQVAKYLPSAVLPKSFAAKSITPVAHSNSQQPAATEPAESEPAQSENMPATFTQEVKPPAVESTTDSTAASEPAGDDRYAAEPSPLDEPAAKPIADATATAPLPLQGPAYTTEQLADALNAATAAQPGLITGDLSDAAVRRTKGMSYAKLCDLAEALTFLNRATPSVESEQASADAERLFSETLSDPRTRSEIDRIASIWIDSPHRRHGGVFLAGQLSGGQILGDIYEYELTSEDGGKLALLAAEPLDPSVESSQRPVGIVGSIIADPAADVAGYHGTANRAIWVTRALPLD